LTEGVFAVLLLVAGLAALASGLIAWSGPIDTVKARSSHVRPTPTGAGLAILAATCAGAALLAPASPAIAGLLVCAAALGLYGALDDLFDFGAGAKLLAQTVACLAVAVWIARVEALPLAPGLTLELPWILAAAGSALFLLVLVNAVNFMDGSDGLAPGWAAVTAAAALHTAAGAGLAGADALAAALLAAVLGFLPWNLRRRVFQGDVGAFFSALVLGGLALLSAGRGATPYPLVFAALPLIVDVLLTLIVRARRGARLAEAHKEHLYQLWLQATGKPHLQLAWRVWLLTAVCAALGRALDVYAPEWAFAGLMGTTGLLSAAWVISRGRFRRALDARPRTAGAAPTHGHPAGAGGTGTPPSR
jgi:Fuc2NAc and GlcNAc transferase